MIPVTRGLTTKQWWEWVLYSTCLHYLTTFELLHVLSSIPNLNLESLFNAVDEKLQRTRKASIEAVIRRNLICNYAQFNEKTKSLC